MKLKKRVRKLLKDLEWAGNRYSEATNGRRACCPSCRGIVPVGHTEDCELVALRKALA